MFRLIVEHSNAPTKPIRNAASGSDFFVLKPNFCCKGENWQNWLRPCCQSKDWKALRVTTPLVSGDDLERGVAQIRSFDKALRTTGTDSSDRALWTTTEPFWGLTGYKLDALARYQDGMTLDRYRKVASLWMILREIMLRLFRGRPWPCWYGGSFSLDELPDPKQDRRSVEDRFVEERVGPMRWSGVNPFLPLSEYTGYPKADPGQSGNIRMGLRRIWHAKDL